MHAMSLHTTQIIAVALLLASMIVPAPARSATLAPQVATTPVLLVVNNTPAAPFGNYLAALLDYEGLQIYTTAALADVTPSLLAQYHLVILAETALTPQQTTNIKNYVNGGGRLVAMKPDAQLNDLFGLGAPAGILSSGYVKYSPTALVRGVQVAADLAQESLQLFAPTSRYSLDIDATEIARLYSDALTPTPYPAVAAKGNAVAFTYDLARNVAYTRQGRPTGETKFGVPVSITQQLYDGWVNLDRIAIPQADEQTRLFARLVEALVNDRMPLPRTWYFPQRARTMMLMASSSHANPGSYFSDLASAVSNNGGRATFYVSIADTLSPTLTQILTSTGHNISPLMEAYRQDFNESFNITSIEDGFLKVTQRFTITYPAFPLQSYRSDLDNWKGWSTAAELAAERGYGMDLNVRHHGGWLQRSDGTWVHGHITGGGRPLPYVAADGRVIPVFQQPLQLDFQHLFEEVIGSIEQLSANETLAVVDNAVLRSQNGDYSALVMHNQTDYAYAAPVVGDALARAREDGAMLMNVDRWHAFSLARQAVRYTDVVWNPAQRQLTFSAAVSNTGNLSVTAMLPTAFSSSSLMSVTVDGQVVPFDIQLLKQDPRALFDLTSGVHTVVAHYALDTALNSVAAVNDSPKPLFSTVHFTASVTPDVNATYVWNFGDGAFGTGAATSHTYITWPPGGILTATVRAQNGQGSVTTSITVRLQLPARARLPLVSR
jgi:PKD domain